MLPTMPPAIRCSKSKQERTTMTMRPDPTFHASPKLAMEAPPEKFAYALLLSPDFSKPDALAIIDTKPSSPTFSQIVHTVTMPYKGDEFHHFGWNACSSALSPLTGHAFLERLSAFWSRPLRSEKASRRRR